MAKEILYKARRTDNGLWIQGYFFQIWEQTFILWGTTNGVPNMIEVDPSTVCQYTGKTDKNEQKIFEGDKLSFSKYVGIVRWHEERLTYGLFDEKEGYFISTLASVKLCEIVGSIFDDSKVEEAQ